jgi:hypothetical protein
VYSVTVVRTVLSTPRCVVEAPSVRVTVLVSVVVVVIKLGVPTGSMDIGLSAPSWRGRTTPRATCAARRAAGMTLKIILGRCCDVVR